MNPCKRHRFPPDIISKAVPIKGGRLCIKFGVIYARRLRPKHRDYGHSYYSLMDFDLGFFDEDCGRVEPGINPFLPATV